MQLGMIGLGRMGANMVRRIIRNGHKCTVFDMSQKAVEGLAAEGATGSTSMADYSELHAGFLFGLICGRGVPGQVKNGALSLLGAKRLLQQGRRPVT